MGRVISVGMTEVKVACEPGEVLVALGLGSCVGICAYDGEAGVAGMAHVVLPENLNGDHGAPGKFASTAVPLLLEEMQSFGAVIARIRVAIAGGAQLFSFNGSAPRMDIGLRNAAAVEQALRRHNIQITAQDIGGNAGRTVQLHAADGRVRVKTIGQSERDLAFLGEQDRMALRRAA